MTRVRSIIAVQLRVARLRAGVFFWRAALRKPSKSGHGGIDILFAHRHGRLQLRGGIAQCLHVTRRRAGRGDEHANRHAMAGDGDGLALLDVFGQSGPEPEDHPLRFIHTPTFLRQPPARPERLPRRLGRTRCGTPPSKRTHFSKSVTWVQKTRAATPTAQGDCTAAGAAANRSLMVLRSHICAGRTSSR